tara:strand:- start:76 stop:246 length:171 start_codon:yes stop_codon:yes gene_type:complete
MERAQLFRQAVAADLFIVAQIDAAIGEGGVGPDEASVADLMSGLDQADATNLPCFF